MKNSIKNPIFNKRQLKILEFVRKAGRAGNREIKEALRPDFDDISRVTVVRDLNFLLATGLILKEGRGRFARYGEKITSPFLAYFNVDDYFEKGPDERTAVLRSFQPAALGGFAGIFNVQEIDRLKELNSRFLKRIKNFSPAALKKEYERLTVEFSWKSSSLEGNTYSLIDTEILIKEKREAKGHKKEEAMMILNHKSAFDYILKNKTAFRRLSFRQIENLHHLLIKDLGVAYGFRKRIVGIVGTSYRPLDNQYQIREALEKTVKEINLLSDPFSKALAAILLISYIQPFEDGNKRTARLLVNALLLANNVCPLSFRSVNEADYKKAIILFYEQNSARFFKELFVQQFEFAVNNYF